MFTFFYLFTICVLGFAKSQLSCVHMKDCPVVHELVRTSNGQKLLQELICESHARYPKIWCKIPCGQGYCSAKSNCGSIIETKSNSCKLSDGSQEDFICCSEPILSKNSNGTESNSTNMETSTSPPTTPETTLNPTEQILDARFSQPDSEICGIAADVDKVINGKIASMHDHPWTVLLQYKEDGKKVSKCGGALISRKFVLTAAHCVHKTRARLVNAVLGEYNVSSETDCFSGVCMPKPLVIAIKRTIVHPEWLAAERPFYHDVAIIELQREVQYNDFVRPICLSARSPQTSSQLVVAGWGKTENGTSSDVKRVARLEVRPRAACLATVRLPLEQGQVCAGGAKTDSCDGDSGGPLMELHYGDAEPTWTLVGVVSLGSGKCGSPGKPAIYTDVSYYYQWVLQEIEGF